MDDIDNLLTNITKRIAESKFSDSEKADAYAQLSTGMRHLVWPILLSHVPKAMLEQLKSKTTLSPNDYVYYIGAAIRDPQTPKEIHDELKGALEEVYTLVNKSL